MNPVYNFSAGPACLPKEVLEKAQQELVYYKDTGMSVMEMSHRSRDYEVIIQGAEAQLRKIMNIPANYKVLFLQGGAWTQFSMVPLNLMSQHKKAYYVNTGEWATKAIKEAKRYGQVEVVASSEDKVFSYIPELDPSMFKPDADYVHITSNNTIYGTRYTRIPDTNGLPLVSDMSSCILSEVFDVSDYGLIYAGAQKNIGPAGVTLVIIREDLIGHAMDFTPTMLNYKTHGDNGSMFNTPPTYCVYIAGLVFDWIEAQGGVAAMQRHNEKKAAMIYDYLDQSAMFSCPTAKKDRSLMNVPFVTGNQDLDKKFVAESTQSGLIALKGHRSVGGMRASIYNAMPIEGVAALINFMKRFEQNNRIG